VNGTSLSPFEGQEVISAGIEIPRAGGGLHDALRIDPRELHLGDVVHVVMRLTCRKVRFDPVKDTESLTRTHVMDAEAATFVDADLVEQQLAIQRRQLDELENGQQLPLGDDDDDGHGKRRRRS
jgi:hypothetical protein